MSEQQPQTQNRNWMAPFFTIWTGQQLSLIGSNVAQFALVWWLTELTGSATVLATASMVALVPSIVLGPIVGVYVDRWKRRTVLVVADGIIALVALWLAYLFWTGAMEVWHVYVVMFVRSIGNSFHWPAMQASTSMMVPEKHLSRVAGLNQAVQGGLNIVGPPLGALLMGLLPLYGVMLVDVGTALLAIIPLFFVEIPQPKREAAEQAFSFWSDIKDGFRYVMGWQGLVALIISAMVFKIVLTPAFSLIPLLVSEHFGGDAIQLGVMESVAGLGILIGGLALGVWGGFRRKIFTTMMGMVVFGVSFTILGLTPSYLFGLGVAMVFIVGVTISLIDGPIMAILQANVAPEMQGRVFTLIGSLLSLTSPFGLALAGPISDWQGVTIWYVVAGILCSLIGISGFFIPALVHIEENNNGGAKQAETTAVIDTRPELEASV